MSSSLLPARSNPMIEGCWVKSTHRIGLPVTPLPLTGPGKMLSAGWRIEDLSRQNPLFVLGVGRPRLA
jgi:hypothetical protein